MGIFNTLGDAFQLSLTRVEDLTDDELLRCNRVRVVLAFIASVTLLGSVFGLFLTTYPLIIAIVVALFWVNSALAVIEIGKRRKDTQ